MGISAPRQRPAQCEIPNSLFPLLFSIFLFLGGCASPGEPVTRRAPVPAPISDLSVQQSGNSAVLTFTLPRYTIEHRLLKRAPSVEIYRAFASGAPSGSAPATPSAAGAPVASGEAPATTAPESAPNSPSLSLVVTIPSALVSHYQQDGEIRYTDPWTPDVLKQHEGEFAVYTVRAAESRRKSSPDSNVASVRVYPAPDPISDLKAQLARGAIDLSWTAPQQTPGGSAPPIKNYEIYRYEFRASESNGTAAIPRVLSAPGAKEAAGQPAKIATVESTAYEDAQVTVGAVYRYVVRGVADYSGQAVESADSNVVTIGMSDVFPPAAPTGLVAVPVAAQNGASAHIDLSWNVSPEADVTGYNLYRSEQEGTPGRRLNSQLLPTPVFSDMSAGAGERYFYRVTAVDRSGNESGPSAAVSGEVPAESQPKQ